MRSTRRSRPCRRRVTGRGRASTIPLCRLSGIAGSGPILRRRVWLPRSRIRRTWSAKTLPARSTLRCRRTIVARNRLARSRLAKPLQAALPLACRSACRGRRGPVILSRWRVGRFSKTVVAGCRPAAGCRVSVGRSLPAGTALTREELRIPAGSRNIGGCPIGKAPAGYAGVERHTAVYQTRSQYLATSHVLHILKTASREIFRSHTRNSVRNTSISVYIGYTYISNINATV